MVGARVLDAFLTDKDAVARDLHAIERKLSQRQAGNALGLACAQLGLLPAQLAALGEGPAAT